MRKNIIYGFFASSVFMMLSCGETKELSTDSTIINSQTVTDIESVKKGISEENISEALKYLSSEELQGRNTGTEGIEKAAVFIEGQLRAAGIKPFFETYRDSFQVNGATGYNILGYKEGTDPALKDEIIIIGAHYDHVGLLSPVNNDSIANGANDNASGTVSVLELAKYFADQDTRRSILFALFSAEEKGLVGSKKLAARLKKEGVEPYMMFNIEMVGVPMNDKGYLAYLTGYDKSNLPDVFNNYSGEEVLGFLPEAEKYNLFKRSDNYAFYEEFGIPAHTASSFDFTNYDFYHHVDDEFRKVNTAHMEQFIEAIVLPLLEIANSDTKEIKVKL